MGLMREIAVQLEKDRLSDKVNDGKPVKNQLSQKLKLFFYRQMLVN